MSGKYKGAQARILEQCPTAIFSPCGCHTLNLCGNDAAECIPETITYFGTIQTVYNLFSSSPHRWKILQNRIGCSLHGISSTRWSDCVESVKPFVAHLPGIKLALEDLLKLNLTAKTRTEINGALSYVTSFICVIMSVVWYKILVPVDICNKVIQSRNATLDVEVSNIKTLISELTDLRNSWKSMWSEAKHVASNLHIEIKLFGSLGDAKRKRRFHDEDANLSQQHETDDSPEEAYFRKSVFYVMLDNVIGGLTVRFSAAVNISEKFSFLWKYLTIPVDELKEKSKSLADQYPADISEDLVMEMSHLPAVHRSNFGENQLSPLELLNCLKKYKLEGLFPNICIGLHILLTILATAASAECSFSKLKLVKKFLRSTMSQA